VSVSLDVSFSSRDLTGSMSTKRDKVVDTSGIAEIRKNRRRRGAKVVFDAVRVRYCEAEKRIPKETTGIPYKKVPAIIEVSLYSSLAVDSFPFLQTRNQCLPDQ